MQLIYRKPKERKSFVGIIEYLFVFFIILSFQTPFAKALSHNYYLLELTSVLSIVLFISESLRVKIKYKMLSNWILVFIPHYVILVFYIFATGENYGLFTFIVRFLVVLPVLSLTFVLYYHENRIFVLFKKYDDIMLIIAVISLFFWLFGSQLHLIAPTGRLYAYWGEPYYYPSYYNLYFERQRNIFMGIESIRNMGIFCEAPMYSFCLVVAIASEVFLVDKSQCISNGKNKHLAMQSLKKFFSLRVLILTITLVTTITTTGYIMFLFILFMAYIISNSGRAYINILKYISYVIVIILLYIMVQQLLIDKYSSVSWIARMDDYVAGYKAWIKSPIWGYGINNLDAYASYMSASRGDGFSNALFVVLCEGGILLLSVYLLPVIFCMRIALKQKQLNIVMFEAVIIIEFIVSIIQFEFITIMILALFYSFIIYSLTYRNIDRDG